MKATSEQAFAQAQEDLGATKKTKAEDQKYSQTLKLSCESKSGEWETRQKSAKGELGAIAKATEILQKGVVALVQTGQESRRSAGISSIQKVEGDRKARAAVKLRDLGRKFHSFQLVELASVAVADPFTKIRGLIQDMIAKLIKEGEEEATHEVFCNSEMKKSEEAKTEKTLKLEKHKARIDQAEAKIGELNDAIKALEKEISEIDAAQSEATKIRVTEKADNTAAMKDFKQSADAVSAAIAVLRQYYEGGSLIQSHRRTIEKHRRAAHKSKQPSFGGASSEAGGNIISILEMAESDFTELFAETEAEEKASQRAYDKLEQENKESRAAKESDAKGKASEVKSLAVGLSNNKEDHAAVSEELNAVTSYIEKLKPECTTKTMSYAERKAARQAEIDGLKEALNTLEGESPALLERERFLSRVRA